MSWMRDSRVHNTGYIASCFEHKNKTRKPLIKNELFFFPVGEFFNIEYCTRVHLLIQPVASALGAD